MFTIKRRWEANFAKHSRCFEADAKASRPPPGRKTVDDLVNANDGLSSDGDASNASPVFVGKTPKGSAVTKWVVDLGRRETQLCAPTSRGLIVEEMMQNPLWGVPISLRPCNGQ